MDVKRDVTLIWNALPDQFRAANNIGTFKNFKMSKMDFSNFIF